MSYERQVAKILRSRVGATYQELKQEAFELAVKARILETDAYVFSKPEFYDAKLARQAARQARVLRDQSHAMKLAARKVKKEAELCN